MKQWRNTLSVIEVIIILLCVIMLIIFFSSKNEEKIDNDSYQVKNYNGIITESYAYDYLNKYVDELIFSGYINENSEKYVEKNYSLVTPNIFGELSNNDKLYLALSNLSNKGQELSKENVFRKYNEYFYEEPELINVKKCKSFIYNKEKEIYQESGTCSIISPDTLMVYKKEYKRNKALGYATIYVGIKNSQQVFTNLDKTSVYDTQDSINFSINDDNYESFSKYIITFKEKDDSLYYFFSIEKAN